MKGGRRTAKGRIINIDDVIAAAPHATAVGNMGVNAQGDELGKGGEVTKTREQRTRAYYKNHPQASNQKVSLKGEMKDQMEPASKADFAGLKPDTADTGKENVRSQPTQSFDMNDDSWTESDHEDIPVEPEVPEPEEFDDVEMPPEEEPPEPTGYREVEQENGDIVMQPYWDDDDES